MGDMFFLQLFITSNVMLTFTTFIFFKTTGNSVRVVNGASAKEGRVEIYWKYSTYYRYYDYFTWSSICDNEWDDNGAAVVCKQLGYSGGSARGGGYYGQGTGSIYLSNISCLGNESNIFGCDNRYVVNDCEHHQDIGVICTGNPLKGVVLYTILHLNCGQK